MPLSSDTAHNYGEVIRPYVGLCTCVMLGIYLGAGICTVVVSMNGAFQLNIDPNHEKPWMPLVESKMYDQY